MVTGRSPTASSIRSVKCKLLLFVGKILVGQERELRAQQADALGAIAQRELDIRQQRDIREHLHAMAVARAVVGSSGDHQFAAERFVALDQSLILALDFGDSD